MPNSEKTWLDRLDDKYKDDPEYITHGLLLEVTEAICGRLPEGSAEHLSAATDKDGPMNVWERIWATRQARRFLNTPTDTTLVEVVKYAQAVGLRVELNLIEKEDDDGEADTQSFNSA